MSSLPVEQLMRLKESVLIEKLDYLCEELGDPGRYFPDLRSKSVLNMTDTQLIKSKATDREKTEEFITLISKRRSSHGQHGLDIFVDALKKQRVHAHVARALLRSLNKKKAEAEKTSSGGTCHRQLSTNPLSPGSGSSTSQPNDSDFIHTPTSDVSNNSASSQLEVHPDHGVLPPVPPPPSSQEDPHPILPDGSIHPQYGLCPEPPPPTAGSEMVSPQQEVTSQPPPPSTAPNGPHSGFTEPSQYYDELGPQSVAPSETTVSSFSTDNTSYSTGDFERSIPPPSHFNNTGSQNSYPSISGSDNTAELDKLQKAFEKLKFEKKQLEQSARQQIQALERENSKLREQLYQQRPSNLHLTTSHGVPAPPYHYSPAGDYQSLTPPRSGVRSRNLSPSPGPVGEKEFPRLQAANSTGSLSSYSSRGSYNPSESQV